MPEVSVGAWLRFQNRLWQCTAIARCEEHRVATDDPMAMEGRLREPTNTRYVAMQFGTFDVGDVIVIKSERVTLEVPEVNVFYLYTYYNVQKEERDASGGESGSGTAEGPEPGVEGGEGAGEEATREGSGAQH